MILFSIVVVIVTVLRRNTSWAPRGITPREKTSSPDEKKEGRNWREKLFTTKNALRGVILLFLIVWGSNHIPTQLELKTLLLSPSLNTIWTFVADYWFWIVVMYCIGHAATQLLKIEKKEEIQWVANATMIMLFVALPLSVWFVTPRQSGDYKVSTQKTGCMMPFTERSFTDHPAFGPDGGYSARDKWLPLRVRSGENSCLVENPKDGHIEWDSDNPSIYDLELSCVYERDGTGSVRIDGCKGGVVTAGYVYNPTDAPVTVWYAYAKN